MYNNIKKIGLHLTSKYVENIYLKHRYNFYFDYYNLLENPIYFNNKRYNSAIRVGNIKNGKKITKNNIYEMKMKFIKNKKDKGIFIKYENIFELEKNNIPRIPSMTDRILFVEPDNKNLKNENSVKLKINQSNFDIYLFPTQSDHLLLRLNLIAQ